MKTQKFLEEFTKPGPHYFNKIQDGLVKDIIYGEECELEYEEIDRTVGEEHRWYKDVYVVIEVAGRYFELHYGAGLTECQENIFEDDEIIEVEKYTETVTLTKYKPIYD